MGNIIHRKRPPSEELDKLVLQINELEAQLKDLLNQRSNSAFTLLYSVVGLCVLFLAYFWLNAESGHDRILYITVTLIISALLYIFLRYLLLGIYDYFINSKRKRVNFFSERKLSILEDVKENEKYRVAREIIEKYGSEEDKRRLVAGSINSPEITHQEKQRIKMDPDSNIPNDDKLISTPTSSIPKLYENTGTKFSFRTPVRPFIEPSHTPIDRILDYVMGESVTSRYALICSNCHYHNGMALREEFEHISYFCYKCNVYNASKKEILSRNSVSIFSTKEKFEEHNRSFFQESPTLQDRPVSTSTSNKEESSEEGSTNGHSSPRGDTGADTDGFERVTDAESDP